MVSKKSIREIIEEATEKQIRSWFEDIRDSEWPKTMPIPSEALDAVWHTLQRAYMNLPLKEKK
jgi:hypothetical protein